MALAFDDKYLQWHLKKHVPYASELFLSLFQLPFTSNAV